MSEPLNNFLEDVESADRYYADDDSEFGRVIRAAREKLLKEEAAK